MTTQHKTLNGTFKDESLGQLAVRIQNGGRRKPLRTLKEMSEEFGITLVSLAMLIKNRNGPKAKYSTGLSSTKRNTWYDPDELRAWWKKAKDAN